MLDDRRSSLFFEVIVSYKSISYIRMNKREVLKECRTNSRNLLSRIHFNVTYHQIRIFTEDRFKNLQKTKTITSFPFVTFSSSPHPNNLIIQNMQPNFPPMHKTQLQYARCRLPCRRMFASNSVTLFQVIVSFERCWLS
jgi:hypothetical protein